MNSRKYGTLAIIDELTDLGVISQTNEIKIGIQSWISKIMRHVPEALVILGLLGCLYVGLWLGAFLVYAM